MFPFMDVWKILFLTSAILFAGKVYGQDPEEPPPPPDPIPIEEPEGPPRPRAKPDDPGVEVIQMPNESDEEGFTAPKEFSAAEKQKTCRKFDGKYISSYGSVYKVEDCQLREVRSQEVVWRLNTKGIKITVVDNDTLAKLDRGDPILTYEDRKQRIRTCRELKDKYVTYSQSDVFYIDKCLKRPFPDWETFIEHRKSKKRAKEEVLALSWEEFSNLKVGPVMESVIDNEFKRLLTGEAGIDVIPIDEACRGLNGKDVSYVDRIYRIEKCRKREYDTELFTRNKKYQEYKLKELTANQWLSLPDGKPMGK